jgi:hypothetical protein
MQTPTFYLLYKHATNDGYFIYCNAINVRLLYQKNITFFIDIIQNNVENIVIHLEQS